MTPTDNVVTSATPVRNRRRRWLAAGVATALMLALVGATAGYALAAAVPRGTSVLGIDLGGKSRADAAVALRTGLAAQVEKLSAPLTVHIGEQTTTVQPQDVGLAVDVDATVAAAAGGFSPFTALFGSKKIDPVVTVDSQRLNDALKPTAAKVSTAMVMPGVTFSGTRPKPIYPKPGRVLDQAGSAEAVRAAWLHSHEATVPLTDVTPVSTAADVDKILVELAAPAVSAPVTVTTDKGTLTASPAVIAASLIIDADAQGKLKSRIDEKKLRRAWKSQLAKVETQPHSASITTKGGAPKVVASTAGQLVDTGKLATELVPVLSRTADRTVGATVKSVESTTTSGDLNKLGIRERVSSFTTHFSGGLSLPRSKNIVQIAKEVDGAIVRPGQTFSLNGHTGPRGYAEGYVDAPIIMDGKLVPGVGGGASQFTTTIFNAAYYAGMVDVEHKPHSYYFGRYPSVIESTIMYPSLDLRFRNDTPYGVLIDTSHSSNSITVSMWSTKVYDSVTTQYDPKRDVTKPKQTVLPGGPTCIATQGSEGFTQDAWRIFRRDGREVKREKFTWRYSAEPRFVCEASKPR